MSLPVHERLIELAADVERVRLAPAADVRARGHSRARRRRAGTAAALAAVAAAAGFGLTLVAGGEPDRVATPLAVPSPACSIPADLTLPDDPGQVVITVVGGSDRVGQVAIELGKRGYAATGQPSIDPDSGSAGPVAVIRYGPRALGTATVVRAIVAGDAVMKFVPDRESRTVDLLLGSDFRGLASPTEMNQKLVTLGQPTRPPGSC